MKIIVQDDHRQYLSGAVSLKAVVTEVIPGEVDCLW